MSTSSSKDLPIIPIGVKDAPFAFELFAHDCPPTQFVREMTRNGIEAIEAYRVIEPDYHGEIVLDDRPRPRAVRHSQACLHRHGHRHERRGDDRVP